jgi:hypothetical protein
VQPRHEKQRFLKLVLKSAVWRDGQLRTEFEDPFENLRRSNRLSRTKQQENGAAVAESQDWLPRHGFELWLTPPELLVALLGKVLGQDRQNARPVHRIRTVS